MSYQKNIIRLFFGAALVASSLVGGTAMAQSDDPNLAGFVQQMRTSYRAMIPSAGVPDEVSAVRAVVIPALGPKRKINARLYVPKDLKEAKDLPVIVFAHGGGFVSGDLDTHDVMLRAIANGARALVLSVDYRLAPENPAPAGLEDVYAALLWGAANANKIGGDSSRIAVCGDSAGANLATEVALLARDRHGPKIAAQWLMYPTVSNKMDTESWKAFGDKNFPTYQVNRSVIAAYVPKGMSPYDPIIAPLWANLREQPATLIQVGQSDPLRDEDIAYAKALNDAGGDAKIVVYDGQMHGFVQFYKDKIHNSGGESALHDGVAFLRAKFDKK
jgi:acetyl esterase